MNKNASSELAGQFTCRNIKSNKIIRTVLAAVIVPVFSCSLLVNQTECLLTSYPPACVQAGGKIYSMSTGEDTYADSQWYISNPGYYIDYSEEDGHKISSGAGIDMDVKKAWNAIAKSGFAKREVVVAVIDTGVDYNHPELSGKIWTNKGEIPGDGIDNDKNGYIDDVDGWDFYNNDASVCHYEDDSREIKSTSLTDNDNHGTHIAGIIAAAADNNIGIAGIASNIDAKIMVLKINGGRDRSGNMESAVKAVKYATMMGADICNMSWGTGRYSRELYKAMKESDMLFVTAAGNSGDNNDKEPIYPADFRLNNMISVTSIDSMGRLSSYSNYGPRTVDIAAPGDDIYSTVVGSYASMSGSSMAVPQVSAVAALLYSCREHLFASEVKNIILNNVKPIPELKGKIKYAGIPDAFKAVESAGELKQDTDPPQISFQTIYNQGTISVPVAVKDLGTSDVRVLKCAPGYKKAMNAYDRQSGLNAVKYMPGIKRTEDFLPEGSGIRINHKKGRGTFQVRKDGIYTIYASDHMGNTAVKTIKIKALYPTYINFTKSRRI